MQKRKLQLFLTLIKSDDGHIMKGLKQIYFFYNCKIITDSYCLYDQVQTALLFIAAY